MKKPLPPGSTIGVIGGGQLGMMTVREAQRMGYRTLIWDPDPKCPASRLADGTVAASFDDLSAAAALADGADVVTFEFEHIDAAPVEWLEQRVPVYPGSRILRISQHRWEEKEDLERRGFPVVRHARAGNAGQAAEAVAAVGFPAVAKTVTAGYDGKGQVVLENEGDLERFLLHLKDHPSKIVVERFEHLLCELSVVAVRGQRGEIHTFPPIENEHRENILHRSTVPARVPEVVRRRAVALACDIIRSYEIVGVLCVEMFVKRNEEVLVNELAPRPHNSGHFSLDACDVSQFEALVRAITGLPMSAPRLLSPCAMVNLLGKHLEALKADQLMTLPGIKLHLYGKRRVERKRKMGHVTILGTTSHDVERQVAFVERMIGEDRVPHRRR